MSDRKLVILPWRGEFGTMVMHHTRWVHLLGGCEKVVWCQEGERVLFPSATAFRHDWVSPPDRMKRSKLFRDPAHLEYMRELEARCRAEYPGYEVLIPPTRHPYYPQVDLKLSIPPLKTPIDVVIAPRYREHGKDRNYQHWQALADGLVARGLVVGLAGIRETSLDLRGIPEDLKAWNLGGGLAGQLSQLNAARVVVATDSGIAHLAVLNHNRVLVIYDAPGKASEGSKFPWTLPHMRAHARVECAPLVWCWQDPGKAVDLISSYVSTNSLPPGT